LANALPILQGNPFLKEVIATKRKQG